MSLIEGKNDVLYNSIKKTYQSIRIKLQSKLTVLRYKKLYHYHWTKENQLINNCLENIKLIKGYNKIVNCNNMNEIEIILFKKTKKLLKSISKKFIELSKINDDCDFSSSIKNFIEFKSSLGSLIHIVSFFSENSDISSYLSHIYQNIDYLIMLNSIFPKPPIYISDLIVIIKTIIEKSITLWESQKLSFVLTFVNKISSLIPLCDSNFIKENVIIEIDKLLLKYKAYIDNLDNNELLKTLILIGRYFIKNLPENLILKGIESISNMKKQNIKKRIINNIKLNLHITKNNEIELTKADLNKLRFKKIKHINENTDSLFNDFIKEFEILNLQYKEIYVFLAKWKDKLNYINTNSKLFNTVKTYYNSCFKLLSLNIQRQSQYQPLSLLFTKLLYHIKKFNIPEFHNFKLFLNRMSKHYSENRIIRNHSIFQSFYDNLQKNFDCNNDISMISLKNVLSKILKCISSFDFNKNYSVIDVLDEIGKSKKEIVNICFLLLSTQSNEFSSMALNILTGRLLEISEVYFKIENSILTSELSLSLSDQMINIYKGLEGVSSFLFENNLINQGSKLLISLSQSIWKLQHCLYEDSFQNRIELLKQNVKIKINDICQTLINQKAPYDIINYLKRISNDIENDPNQLIEICNNLTQLYNEKKIWNIENDFNSLIYSIELIISRLNDKYYKHIFHNNDQNIHFNKENNETNVRSGILLAPLMTIGRLPKGPHVRFDLSNDGGNCSPIFATNIYQFKDVTSEIIPHPIPPIIIQTWNVQLMTRTIKVPNLIFTKKVIKKKDLLNMIKKYLHTEFSLDLLKIKNENESKTNKSNVELENLEEIKNQLKCYKNKFDNYIGKSEKILLIAEYQLFFKNIPPNKISEDKENEILFKTVMNDTNKFLNDLINNNENIHPFEHIINIDTLLDILLFLTDKIRTEYSSMKPDISDISNRWYYYTKQVKSIVSKLIQSEDKMLFIFMKNFIDVSFVNYLMFWETAKKIDSLRSRNILTIIQTQICNNFYSLFLFMRKLSLTKSSPSLTINSLIQSIDEDNNFTEIKENIVQLLKQEDNIHYEDADIISMKIETCLEKISPLSDRFLDLCRLKYNLLNLNFLPFDTCNEISINICNSCEYINRIIQEIKENKQFGLKYQIMNGWTKFLIDANSFFNNLKFVICLVKNSNKKMMELKQYIECFAKEITSMECTNFPFPPTDSYKNLADNIEIIIDFLYIPKEKLKEVILPSLDVSGENSGIMPKTKFYINNPFVIEKVNIAQNKYISRLLNTIFKFFTKEIPNTIDTNYKIIEIYCKIMISIVKNPNENDIKEILQNNYFQNTFDLKSDKQTYFLLSNEVELNDKLELIISFISELNIFNLLTLLQKEPKSESLIKSYERISQFINFDINILFGNDNNFIIAKEQKLFESLLESLKEMIHTNNIFKLSETQINDIESLTFKENENRFTSIDIVAYIKSMIDYLILLFNETGDEFYSKHTHFYNALMSFSYCINGFGFHFLINRVNSVKDLFSKLKHNFDNPLEIHTIVVKIVFLLKEIKTYLLIIQPVIKETNDKEKYVKLISLLKSTRKQLKQMRTKVIFNNLLTYIKILQKSSMLRIRSFIKITEFTDFILSVQFLIDSDESAHTDSLKSLLEFLLPTFPEINNIRNYINEYLLNYI